MWGEHMPDFNLEQKIQEALKRKSFKENKLEYITLSLVFCLILYVTFVIAYFVPFLAILIFLFVDIPLLMGFKHFIWFGPASGETLLDGFKVSIICGYLNFVSYLKIFVTTNLRALGAAILSIFVGELIGGAVIIRLYGTQIFEITSNSEMSIIQMSESLMNIEGLNTTTLIIEWILLLVGVITFYIIKVQRAVLPYVSFLRLTNLEGRSMDGVIAHTKRVINVNKWSYYLYTTLYHLLYLVPVLLMGVVYYYLSKNPAYSIDTITLVSSLGFFIGMAPALLFVELYYRKYCLDVNHAFHKERNTMLNDALNDLNKNSSNKN